MPSARELLVDNGSATLSADSKPLTLSPSGAQIERESNVVVAGILLGKMVGGTGLEPVTPTMSL